MTTSGTSRIFNNVSLGAPVLPLYAGEKTAIGGLEEKILKKLNGAKLACPSLLIVLAKQIGLGAIAFCKYFCKTGIVSSFGFRLNIRTTKVQKREFS